ncbi:MAG: hypothetical protein EBS05_02495 [Proteobacteria bacterium]|nr:hypothetical protein [Pseudomonadota bacterium]
MAAFGVWALGGHVLGKAIGEGGLYAVCALVFIGLAGVVFGQLVIGPGGTRRIYGLFMLGFTAYSIVWTGAWFGLRGSLAAEVTGAVLGSLAMAGVLVAGFGTGRKFLRAATVLVVLNALGYFIGEVWWRWVPGEGGAHLFGTLLSREQRVLLSQLGWGILFGGGFGSGVGYVIYQCQQAVRVHLRTEIPLTPKG